VSRPSNLTGFVRDALGCGCPPEVLADIRASRLTLPGLSVVAGTRLDVGGRLLVYILVAAGDQGDVDATAAVALAAGLGERDRDGFNRFRLVVAAAQPERVANPVVDACLAAGLPRGRVHLHVVPLSALPELG
jgi:hypothetical protein